MISDYDNNGELCWNDQYNKWAIARKDIDMSNFILYSLGFKWIEVVLKLEKYLLMKQSPLILLPNFRSAASAIIV